MHRFDSTAPLLPEILSLHGKWRGSKDAVVCGQERWSWAEFCGASHRFAHGLIQRELKSGDRIAIVMSNGLPMVQAIFGAMAAGAVSVPINLSVNDEALATMLLDAGVKALVVSADQHDRLVAMRPLLPDTLKLLITSGPGGGEWRSMDDICASQPSELPRLMLAPDAPLNIIYSSGTTGLPKGILHTHQGRRDWAYDLSIALRYNGSARTLLTIGLYSNISWVAMLSTLLSGGTLIVHSRFETKSFLQAVAKERITHTAMVPIQFQRVIEELKCNGGDVSSMQAMMSCGAPLHESLKREIFEYFPCGIIELYGLTEGIITTLEPEDACGRWSSVGKPLIGTDICIVSDADEVVGPNQSGEIVSRGRISMPGYWGRQDANLEAEFIDREGVQWLRSGDIGYVDGEGFLYIVDRKKDMILSGGQNIYPQDIEAILIDHDQIAEAAVIGLPSSRWDETPVALIVLGSSATASAAELLEWANRQLGKQQRLADVIFLEQLPRNPNGKILKRDLRKQFSDRTYA